MNFIDIILILIVLLSIWSGIERGFIAGIVGLFSWLASLCLTFWLYGYLANFIGAYLFSNVWTIPVAFLICLIFSGILISSVLHRLLVAIPPGVHRNIFNKILGFLPGFVVGMLYAAIIAGLLLLLPLSTNLTLKARESSVAQPLTSALARIEQLFAPVFGEAVQRSITRMTIDPESSESVDLPFTVTDASPRPELERQMLHLINQEREKAGLNPLDWDEELLPVARAHSADMFAKSYFSHITPDGQTPFDRIRAARVPFLVAGENLAIAQTLALAHQGLMNSPGHRANILRPTFGRVGIGILDGGKHGLMVTQKFRN